MPPVPAGQEMCRGRARLHERRVLGERNVRHAGAHVVAERVAHAIAFTGANGRADTSTITRTYAIAINVAVGSPDDERALLLARSLR